MAQYGLGTWRMNDTITITGCYVYGEFIVFDPLVKVYTSAYYIRCSLGAFSFDTDRSGRVWAYRSGEWRDERCRDIIVIDCDDPDINDYVLGNNGHLVAPLRVKNGSNWVFPDGKIKVNGTWRQLGYGWTKVNGVWRRTV